MKKFTANQARENCNDFHNEKIEVSVTGAMIKTLNDIYEKIRELSTKGIYEINFEKSYFHAHDLAYFESIKYELESCGYTIDHVAERTNVSSFEKEGKYTHYIETISWRPQGKLIMPISLESKK